MATAVTDNLQSSTRVKQLNHLSWWWWTKLAICWH